MSFLLVLALLGSIQSPHPTHTFTRSQRLEVAAITTAGEPLPGVSVSLCRYDGSGDPTNETSPAESSCSRGVTDASGKTSFEAVPANEYYLKGDLDGFAQTAIYPLSIGAHDPIAPDQVVLMLNPVCWHC